MYLGHESRTIKKWNQTLSLITPVPDPSGPMAWVMGPHWSLSRRYNFCTSSLFIPGWECLLLFPRKDEIIPVMGDCLTSVLFSTFLPTQCPDQPLVSWEEWWVWWEYWPLSLLKTASLAWASVEQVTRVEDGLFSKLASCLHYLRGELTALDRNQENLAIEGHLFGLWGEFPQERILGVEWALTFLGDRIRNCRYLAWKRV